MIYLPLLVFVGVAVWVAGWRKALEITAASLFICLIFGVSFGVLLPIAVLPRILLFIAAVGGYFVWKKEENGT